MSITIWMILRFICVTWCSLLFCLPFGTKKKKISLLLDPAGDQKRTGRLIDDSFERTITLKLAQGLKKELEKKYPALLILFSRFPGDTIEQNQKAHFANQLNVDVVIGLHAYQEQHTKPQLFIYYFANNSMPICLERELFIPFGRAHKIKHEKTQQLATLAYEQLTETSYQRLFDVHRAIGIPFMPLKGLTSPAIAFEIGLKNKHDWSHMLRPLLDAIDAILASL